MPRTSAALVPVHVDASGVVRLFIGQMGGPLWARKAEHSWSLLKGEYDAVAEDARTAAAREYAEEVGAAVPAGDWLDLGELRTSNKRIRVFAVVVEDRAAVSFVASNEFEMEWPPRSGRHASFPEIVRAEWVSVADAAGLLVKGQLPVLRIIDEALGSR